MQARQLDWKLILAVLPAGVLFAAATIFGWIHGYERSVAPVLLLIAAFVVAWHVRDRPFAHGFLAGFLIAEAAILLQALFLETYFANNPDYRAIEIPFGLAARTATFLLSPINAILAGLLVGVVVWGLQRTLLRRRC